MRHNSKANEKPTRKEVFEDIQTRKIISAYGSVGSIVETRHGSILIKNFDEWDFYKNNIHLDSTFHLEDKRLLNRLRQWFPLLKELIRVPTNTRNEANFPSESKHLVSAEYFPKWMFCPKCKRFDHLDNWCETWKNTVKEAHKADINPPKCFHCYQNTKGNKRFYELEQVRFILISANGEIEDIPWDRWVFARKDRKGQANDKGEQEDDKFYWSIDFKEEIPKDIYFQYTTSDKFNDLKGISIIAKDIQSDKEIKRQTLQGIFNLNVNEKDMIGPEYNRKMKVVVRSSNSVYYPNIISSLYLPIGKEKQTTDITDDIAELIKKKKARNRTLKEIREDLEDDKGFSISEERLKKFIDNDYKEIEDQSELASLLEVDYRLKEYQFITSNQVKYEEELENRLIFEKVPDVNVGLKALTIFRIDRLKMTSVQTSYTRTEPIDKDYYLNDDRNNTQSTFIKKKYTSKYNKNTHYLPAIESYGEGIFIEFSKEALEKWLLDNQQVITHRVGHIQQNYNKNKGYRLDRVIEPKFVLIHTFSHLIIKELEFLCGYPATSILERLYVSNDMQGILIYTIAGSEGSYGGLTSICRSEKIGKIIKSAIIRAMDCASDPICYHTDLGQGVGGVNLAACHSCALLPETSCEEFNSFLDRALIVDKEFGFFK